MEDLRARIPGLIVREMGPTDYLGVVGLWGEAGLSHRPEGRDRRDRLAVQSGRPCSLFLVAEVEGSIVGTAFATHDGRKGWINRVAVTPRLRKRGLASLMVERLEHWFDEQGIDIVALHVERPNKVSIALFQRLGYVLDRDILYLSKRRSPEV